MQVTTRPGLVALGIAAAAFCSGCTTEPPVFSPAQVVSGPDDRVYIVDLTGKKWDVTHAVEHYGFIAEEFQHGAGPNAIPPINEPEMLSPGDPGYPLDDDIFLVIGTTIAGDTRSYSIGDLNRHEVVNESFGDVHVAVGW